MIPARKCRCVLQNLSGGTQGDCRHIWYGGKCRIRLIDDHLLVRRVQIAVQTIVAIAGIDGVPLIISRHRGKRRQNVAGGRGVRPVAMDAHRFGVNDGGAFQQCELERAGLVISTR